MTERPQPKAIVEPIGDGFGIIHFTDQNELERVLTLIKAEIQLEEKPQGQGENDGK